MFFASKLLALATQPLTWVALLFALALLCVARKRPLGLRLGWISLGLLLMLGWQPLPDALLRRLEAQYPPPVWAETATAADWQRYAGMVVLGGGLEPAWVRAGNGQVALNASAERMTVPVVLMRQHPHLRLLFTGGDAALHPSGEPQAVHARVFFESLDVPPERMQFEAGARTTYENAVLTAVLPGVDKSRPWLLVTSAWHMPRALAIFRAAGWNVTPYPVDYLTGTRTPWTEYAPTQSLQHWQMALHEWVGLLFTMRRDVPEDAGLLIQHADKGTGAGGATGRRLERNTTMDKSIWRVSVPRQGD